MKTLDIIAKFVKNVEENVKLWRWVNIILSATLIYAFIYYIYRMIYG